MKHWIRLIVLALIVQAGVASAQGSPEHYKGALGFHSVDAPLGVRWWLSDKLAFDAGLGFGSNEVANENFSNFTFDLGLPVMLKSWDKVHFIVRPGILYHSQEVIVALGPPLNKDSDTSMSIGGELEAEVFLADNFSVSAAHGIAIVNTDPAVGGSSTDWGTTGSNFTSVGFHVYLFGSK